MLEKDIIQELGFRNVRKNGQVVGFQVRYRSCYYRSVWLSMSLGFDVSVDGEKFSRDQVTVTIGGAPATVTFSGLVPGFAGLYQIDARVPAMSATGDAVPVSVTISGAASNTVTIAVR